MPVVDWPLDLWNPNEISWHLRAQTTTSGPGYNGRSTVWYTENRVWMAEVSAGKIWHGNVPKHRALIHSLRGRSTIVRIPVLNLYHYTGSGGDVEFFTRIGLSPADAAAGSIPYSDGSRFSDGSGFAPPENVNPVAVSAVARGRTEIELNGFLIHFLGAGAFFTIDDFLYEIESTDGNAATFHPPLRTDVAAGATVEIKDPRVRMRLEDDGQGRITESGNRTAGPVTISFTEVFER